MTQFHAVMLDETGCEFGVSFTTTSRDAAYDYLQEQYPESNCIDLADTQMAQQRDAARYERLSHELDEDFDDCEW